MPRERALNLFTDMKKTTNKTITTKKAVMAKSKKSFLQVVTCSHGADERGNPRLVVPTCNGNVSVIFNDAHHASIHLWETVWPFGPNDLCEEIERSGTMKGKVCHFEVWQDPESTHEDAMVIRYGRIERVTHKKPWKGMPW